METAANAITIETDLPCAICGYNLRGLASDANCPECGQAVARTFTPDLLRSDPKWLRHQANTMLLLGALCLVNFEPERYRWGWIGVWITISLLAAAASIWACWRLATSEPPGPTTDGEATRQRMLRAAPIIYTGVFLSRLVGDAFNSTVLTVAGISALASLIATNGLAAYFIYRLACRTRDRFLILHARIVLWSFPISQVVNVLAGLLPLAFNGSRSQNGYMFVLTLIAVINWVLSLSVYLALLLMGRMYEVLHSAARAAEIEPAKTTV